MVSWAVIARRIRVPLGFAFAFLYLWLAKPTTKSILIGTIVVLAGLWLRAMASGHIQKNAELTVTGPYAYTRNPLYLGSLILASGFAAAARSWWIAALVAAMFLIIYVPVIQSEEEFLRVRFAEFERYARSVPVLLPNFGLRGRFARPHQAGGASFSWELYLKHREYRAALGAFATMLVLSAKMFWSK
jgi:protein-S-isoprenylcysteine O-methyltransferase Ste14